MSSGASAKFEQEKRARGWNVFTVKPPAAVCCLILSLGLAMAAEDPDKLQKQGIERVEQYRDHFYRTGDRDSLHPQLDLAERELKSSYDAFVAKKDSSAAAISEVQLGRLENIRSVESLSISTAAHGINMAAPQPIEEHNETAFRLFSDARDLAKKANDPGTQAEALMGLARTDGLDRGNISDGVDDVTEAVRLASKAGNEDDLFDSLTLGVELELKRGRLAAAIAYMDRAMGMRQSVKKKLLVYFAYRDRADIYRNRVEVCVTEPRYDLCYQALKLARADLNSALQLAREQGYQFLAQDTQRESGELDVLQGLMQDQEQLLKSNSQYFSPKVPKDVLVTQRFGAGSSPDISVKIRKFLQQNPGVTGIPDAQSYYLQGRMREIEGNNDAAAAAYEKMLQLLEEDRGRLRDEESRATFLEDKIEYYYAPAELLLNQHRFGEAFALMEKSRSRSMADLLKSRPLDLGTAGERELFSELEQLRARIGAEQQKLFRFTAAGPDKHATEIAQAEAEIKALEAQEQILAQRIAKEAPKLQELTTSGVVTLESAQELAREEKYDMLYYLALSTEVIVWHIGADDVEVFNIFLPRSFLIDKVQKLRSSLTARAHDENAQFDEQTSRELYLFLIQPVLKSIKTRHLVIVPHEDLNYVPFQALQDPSDGMYVGEKFQVSYAPSASVLDLLRSKPDIKDGRLLAVANPTIEAARTEVKTIGSLYPGRSKIVADAPVKKADLKAWAPGYNLLHLSVHGQFEESDPLLSYLELNPESQEDGHLTAAEMFGLPLPKGSMVVLSACETGRVMATHANELLGMERALLYAGASDLVLSSWEVDAVSTALWMETFYREAQKNPPSEAARLALLAVKARPEYRHPYYWSPFLLTGK